jgi:ATP-binding cassette subfamily F protein uup
MNVLQVNSLSKSYADKILFQDITFGIEEGEKIALIAKNGSGKTTLLNIICGRDHADDGIVSINKQASISYLSQNPEFDENASIEEIIFHVDNPFSRIVNEYEKLINLESVDEHKLAAIIQQMDNLNAWDYEARVKRTLEVFKINHLQHKVKTLSGGQKKRLALAQMLIHPGNVVVMDEPTNHLDMDMIEWLEDYLSQTRITLLMVTHDRYFLDRVCTKIIELDNGVLYEHKGNYSYYLEQKSLREAVQLSETEKAKNLFRRELEWIRKQPKARGTKAKYRVDAFEEVKEKAFQKNDQQKVQLDVKMSRLGSKILEIDHLSKSYGSFKIIDDYSYAFKKGEKVGIVGRNGVGKSTFLKMIMNIEMPDGGTMTPGETIVFGYYSQDGLLLKEDKRIIDVITEIADVIPLSNGSQITAAQMLERFLFSRNMQYSYVSKLSGGEKRRLYLLSILMKNPNFLILDEPTNDLDLVTLNVLEDFLEDFKGCLMIVSHDRYMLDKLVDHLFIFEGDGLIKDFNGKYSEYRSRQLEQENVKEKEKAMQKEKQDESQKITVIKKLTYKEQKEYETLEKEIEKLEQEKTDITAEIGNKTDYQQIQELSHRLIELTKSIENKSERWIELAEKII